MNKKLKVPEAPTKDVHDPFAEGIRRRTEARDQAREQKRQQRRALLDEMNSRGGR